MRREYWQVTGRGGYILYTNIHNFFNMGIRGAQMNTDHRMVLVELLGEGTHRDDSYRRRSRCCPIKTRTVKPLKEGETSFATLKGEVDRAQWPTKL